MGRVNVSREEEVEGRVREEDSRKVGKIREMEKKEK